MEEIIWGLHFGRIYELYELVCPDLTPVLGNSQPLFFKIAFCPFSFSTDLPVMHGLFLFIVFHRSHILFHFFWFFFLFPRLTGNFQMIIWNGQLLNCLPLFIYRSLSIFTAIKKKSFVRKLMYIHWGRGQLLEVYWVPVVVSCLPSSSWSHSLA